MKEIKIRVESEEHLARIKEKIFDLEYKHNFDGRVNDTNLNSVKEFKIRVESREHSKKVQKKLFDLGYRWYFNGRTFCHLDALFLYVFTDDRTISYSTNEDCFNFYNSKEVKLVEKISYEIQHSGYDFVSNKWKPLKLVEKISYEFEEVEPRKVVKVGEISYYEDELAEALKNIKPIGE